MKISVTSDRHRIRLAKAHGVEVKAHRPGAKAHGAEVKAHGRGAGNVLEGAGFVYGLDAFEARGMEIIEWAGKLKPKRVRAPILKCF